MSTHNGHRQHVMERLRKEGIDSFQEHQVLEMLLFFSIPRKDTNEIAHRLINRFGSLAQVLDAPARELEKVDGIGKKSAEFLSILKEVFRYYQVSRVLNNRILPTIEDCANYMLPFFDGRMQETVYMLCLDAKCMVLGCHMLGEGGINSTGVSIRKIVDSALTSGASSVVLAHNHPSGLAVPSQEDVQTTKRIVQALQLVDVTLNDHLIIANGEYTSMKVSRNYKMTVFDAIYE